MDFNRSIIVAAAVAAGVAAAAVLLRARGSLAGKLFAMGMLLFAAESAINYTLLQQTAYPSQIRWREMRFVPLALLPVVWTAFSLTYSRSNYREYLQNWRWVLGLAGVVPVAMLLLGGNHLLVLSPDPEYPSRQMVTLGWSGQSLLVSMVLCAVLVLMNLERTFRASVGTQRWRLKLVMIGLGGLFIARVYGASQGMLHGALEEPLMVINAMALIVACFLVGFSVLRTGEFSIDLYPSQAALHRSVILLAVGAYLVVIGLLAKLSSLLGGTAGFQLRALVILLGLVSLALLLMSDRIREKTRAWVFRHFDRPTYSYRAVWEDYTRSLAGCDSEEAAGQALCEWVSSTMQALSVSVWLLDEHGTDLRLAGTTLEPGKHPGLDEVTDTGTRVVILQSVAHLSGITDLDADDAPPIAAIGRLHPRVFPKGGHRLVAPLTAGRNNLGVIIAGDRVSVVPFASEDRELLATIGNQAGSFFNGLRLSRRVAESREMAAFQSMSTFFVHDLKNTASSLSLMLQNLPRHFDNPAFREDALRSIRRSVERINQIVQSLTSLRERLVVNRQPGDLSQFAERIRRTARERNLTLDARFDPAGPVLVDEEQLDKVLTNLLVNAHEASAPGSLVKVRTGLRDRHAFLSVRDEGCGMAEEFIRSRLFRPFQTTKREGTGIGLYHSRLIVDAHGGRLEVQSAVGRGTTFTLLVPLTAPAASRSSADESTLTGAATSAAPESQTS
ncbi:MAG TPA: PEP-CTERM system histidine kinase PrsK [Verrucomicrobiales bacterium]|nr:PEP-CTERM system histidine kinase PrsK [Verrucomicrobiales bacterium]